MGADATHELFSTGFDASWELDLFGATRRALEAAQADLEASEADLHGAQVSLAAEVALNYVELRTFQARLAIARENLASQSETLQLAEWRAQAGLVTSLDVEQSRANREQTRAQIPTFERAAVEAGHRLAILLGRAPGTLDGELAGDVAIPAVPADLPVGIPADTLRQRPDVRAAERRLAAETATVGQATAALYPRLTLGGSIGLEALTAGDLASSGAVVYSLLAGLTAPIFDAGRLRRQVQIRSAIQEQALASYESAVLTALEDVENALISLSTSRERQSALGDGLGAARTAAALARQQYTAGLMDFQAVLDTQRSVLAIEDGLAAARGEAASALVGLYKALGGGWSPGAVVSNVGTGGDRSP
jgi:NodT family efflux transporter outer membrane factor (OMF) lipoprotein